MSCTTIKCGQFAGVITSSILVVYHSDMAPKSSLMATVAIRVAPNLTDNIVDQLKDDPPTLRQCSLVSKLWRARALKWLFEAIVVQFAADPRSYLRWVEEPMLGTVYDGPRVALGSADARSLGLHLAGIHARELHLVQYQSFMWITPHLLYPILPRLAAFNKITSLSLHSFSIHPFDATDIRTIFRHLFQTVRDLNLEEPHANAASLLGFLSHFKVLDDLSISDPEWDHECGAPSVLGEQTWPPLRGTLHFLRIHEDSAEFINLLADITTALQEISLVNCQLPSALINRLLNRTSSSLKIFSMSAWSYSGLRLPRRLLLC